MAALTVARMVGERAGDYIHRLARTLGPGLE